MERRNYEGKEEERYSHIACIPKEDVRVHYSCDRAVFNRIYKCSLSEQSHVILESHKIVIIVNTIKVCNTVIKQLEYRNELED